MRKDSVASRQLNASLPLGLGETLWTSEGFGHGEYLKQI
jgi:hypothetical protein